MIYDYQKQSGKQKFLQRCHTYIPGRTSVRLGRKNVPKVTMLLVIHDSYRFLVS